MLYAYYDNNNGAILGFYDSNIHLNIPNPSIEISKEDWEAHINGAVLMVKKNKLVSCSKKDIELLYLKISTLTPEQKLETKINEELRKIAIERLQNRGEL